jgi:hypothetical protein
MGCSAALEPMAVGEETAGDADAPFVNGAKVAKGRDIKRGASALRPGTLGSMVLGRLAAVG